MTELVELLLQVEQHLEALRERVTEIKALEDERRRASRELSVRSERFEALLTTTMDGFVVVEPNSGRIIRSNDVFCEMIGYTQEELHGLSIQQLDVNDQTLALMASALNGTLHRFETVLRCRDGTILDVEVSTKYLLSRGKQYLVNFVRDVTQLKRTEAVLRQTESLRTLGQMASGVAHDFHNLLSVIFANAGLALLNLESADLAALREDLQLVMTGTQRAIETVSSLQAVSLKAESARELNLLQVDDVATEAISLTRPFWYDQAKRKQIAIQVETDLTAPPKVYGSQTDLCRVIMNLIINAVEAMPEGGIIRISTTFGEGWVTITVSDTGIGISPADMDSLFEPFYTTKGDAGTGLGLAMSLEIIEYHSGKIDVESEVGKGTTFRVCLPMPKEDAL